MGDAATVADAVLWDRVAWAYRFQQWLERRPLRRLLEMLDPQPGERMLDIGTGPATLPALLAARGPARRPEDLVGIDSSASMLERAPRLPEGWTLQQADATRLPFAAGSFDLISAAYLLHVLEPVTRGRVLAEAARVLRPGGRLGLITIAPPRRRWSRLLTAPLRAAAASQGALRGLRALDPAGDLGRAGFAEAGRDRVLAGYPSLCLVAGVAG